MDLEDDICMTVWLPFSVPEGTDAELARYSKLAEEIDVALMSEGLGTYDGAATGTTHANLYFTMGPSNCWERASQRTAEILKCSDLASKAMAAVQGFITRVGQTTRIDNVIWPPGFRGPLPR